MAGSGIAIRLHDFKDRCGTGECHGAAEGARVLRQGRDVLGVYPGQLGRAHIVYSPFHRPKLTSLECPPWPKDVREEERYRRSFDLLTLQALDQSTEAQRAAHTPLTHTTTYQEEFGHQSHLYPPDHTKMTLSSHPAPLD